LITYHSHAGEWDAVSKLLHDVNTEIRRVCLGHLCRCSIWGCKLDATPAIPAIIDFLPGDKDTQRIISNLIRDKNLQVPVLDAAIRSSKLSVDEAWPYLEMTSRAREGWVAGDAQKLLGKLEKTEKLAFVLETARTRQGEPRRWAIHQVDNLHTFEHVSIQKAIPDLLAFLSDEDPFVRAEAATTIAHKTSYYDTCATKPHLVRLLGDPAARIQECAAMALAAMARERIDISEALDALASILLRSTRQETRGQAAIAFYNLAEKGKDLTNYLSSIVQALKDTYEPVRDLCTWAITRYLMNAGNAQRFLELLNSAGIEKSSGAACQVRERAKSLLK